MAKRSRGDHTPQIFKPFPVEVEHDLARKWLVEKDVAARDALLIKYLPLCRSMVLKIAPGNPNHEDLLQEAVLGMMTALDRFDIDRGLRFGTYARWWIRASLSETAHSTYSDSCGVTGNPSRLVRGFLHAKRAASRNLERSGRDPEGIALRMEIARLLNMPVKKIEDYELTKNCGSLNDPIPGYDSEEELIDQIPARAPGVEDLIDEKWKKDTLHSVLTRLLDILTPRERDIVSQRFGLTGPEKTLREISEKMSVTPERVRQIEKTALQKIYKKIGKSRDIGDVVTQIVNMQDRFE